MLSVESSKRGFNNDSVWGASSTPIVFCGICWYAFEKKELVNDAPKKWALFSFIGAFLLFFWLCIDACGILLWQIQHKSILGHFFLFFGNLLGFINGCLFGVRAFKEGMDIKQNNI